jgi:acetoin utilization deacetylase AcuC-like enzyme
MKVYFSPDYVLSAHAFDTTRKAGWIADSLRADPIPGVELVAPEPLTTEQLVEVHSPEYVNAVRTGEPHDLAASQGFSWDPGLWTMVGATNGGAVAAALTALKDGVSGSLSSGLHHARRGHGSGFCTFNGLALAARAALRAGAHRVFIVDLDAHCGGGTWSIAGPDERIFQIDVSVSPVDAYQPTARASLDVVRSAPDYLPTIQRRLGAPDLDPSGQDLVLYNAGMDPYEGCPIGGLRGITRELLAERERTVFSWCARRAVPVAFVLAGGYLHCDADRAQLVALHRLTIEAGAVRW